MSAPSMQSVHGFQDPAGGCRAKRDLELPAADTKRWSSRRKAAVVIAVRGGIITRAVARERYALSEEELAGWEVAFERRGIPGLRSGIRNSDAPTAKVSPAQSLSHELG